ncbi:uncharacterized protein [Typha angustifolia]|uniref:uncharacterized protein n=1 Tax=Typha angustifolia TaxID=59011 RepID=UPI003C2EBE9A
MKRFGFVEELDSINNNIASMLVLLSRGGGVGGGYEPERVFECKTCNRQFTSFQALGGHRASHKKPKLAADGAPLLAKPKVHECTICGLEFGIGQALGGHMRRHRAAAAAAVASEGFVHGHDEEKKKMGHPGRMLWLDLNKPAMDDDEEEVERRRIGFKFEFMEKAPVVVDCFP